MLLQQTSRVGLCRDSRSLKRFICRQSASATVRVAAAASQQHKEHEEKPRLAGLGGLAWSAAALLTAVASPVLAEEETYEAVQAVLQANDVEVAPQNLLVTIGFTIVVGLLSVVTLGVLYIGITSALDKKQEFEDRQKVEKGEDVLLKPDAKQRSQASGGKGGGDEEPVLSLRKSTIAKKDKTKGFAGVADPKNREF